MRETFQMTSAKHKGVGISTESDRSVKDLNWEYTHAKAIGVTKAK